MSVEPRLKRLFAPNGKCSLQVAMDHGVANEATVLPGIENMGKNGCKHRRGEPRGNPSDGGAGALAAGPYPEAPSPPSRFGRTLEASPIRPCRQMYFAS